MAVREIFARNLKMARKIKGMSQEDLAFEAGIDRTYISSLERAVYSPTLDVVERLAKALEIDAFWLITPPDQQD